MKIFYKGVLEAITDGTDYKFTDVTKQIGTKLFQKYKSIHCIDVITRNIIPNHLLSNELLDFIKQYIEDDKITEILQTFKELSSCISIVSKLIN